MEASENIYGLILSGGKSSRMGIDKGTIEYHGLPQREFLFSTLSNYCGRVFTSCYAGQIISGSLNPLEDAYEIKSPMNGILSAFKNFPDKAWLVVAVDMPYVDGKVFEQIIANRNTEKVATCFYNEAEKLPEPLLTLWEPRAFRLLLKFADSGRISPRDFLANNDIQLVTTQNPEILLNVNSQEEYIKFKNKIKPD